MAQRIQRISEDRYEQTKLSRRHLRSCGTLLDTLDDLANAANAALHSARLPATSRRRLPSVRRQRPAHARPPGLPEETDRIGTTGFRSTCGTHGRQLCQRLGRNDAALPAYPRTLQQLQRRSIPLAVVTEQSRTNGRSTCSMLLSRVFLFIQGAMPNLPPWPIHGALNAARHLGSIPSKEQSLSEQQWTC